MINSFTIPAFIIGHPVTHSKSPIFQNKAFDYNKINSVYLAIDIEPEYFDQIINSFKKINIYGLNITIPYKIDIIKYLDEIIDEARIIGSVNTIKIINKKWYGYNTDWYGVYMTLKEYNIPKDSKSLIIGAGGATNGVIYGLQQYGINNITITNRTYEKLIILKNNFKDINIFNYQELINNINNFNFIINTTSIDFNNILPEIDNNKIYFDLKYYGNKINKSNFIDGTLMLLYQGVKAFEIWSEQKAPVEIMKKALFETNDI